MFLLRRGITHVYHRRIPVFITVLGHNVYNSRSGITVFGIKSAFLNLNIFCRSETYCTVWNIGAFVVQVKTIYHICSLICASASNQNSAASPVSQRTTA